jgi:hypothetical protein
MQSDESLMILGFTMNHKVLATQGLVTVLSLKIPYLRYYVNFLIHYKTESFSTELYVKTSTSVVPCDITV